MTSWDGHTQEEMYAESSMRSWGGDPDLIVYPEGEDQVDRRQVEAAEGTEVTLIPLRGAGPNGTDRIALA
jgi:hypothetical protein